MAIPIYSTEAASAFVARQLVDVSQRAEEQLLPKLNAMVHFEPLGRVAPGARAYSRQIKQNFGRSKWLAAEGDDAPKVGVGIIEDIYNVGYHGVYYGWSQEEILAAQFANTDLEGDRAYAARLAIAQFNNEVAFYGDAEKQITGLLSIPYIPRHQYSKNLFRPGADPQQTLAAMLAMESDIILATKQGASPNVLAMDLESYNFVASTQVSVYNNRTILEVFKQNAQSVREVFGAWELSGAGPNGEPMLAMLSTDARFLEHNIPIPFMELAPQFLGYKADVPCLSSTAGMIASQPLAHMLAELI